MRLSLTLSKYIAQQFLLATLLTLFSLAGVGLLIDAVELIRRASGRDAVGFITIVQMALLKTPQQMQKFLPFAALIGSMLALMKLTRTHELVVARAAGVSVWQFLLPAAAVVMMLGIGMVSIFNPLSAVMLLKFEQMEGKYLTNQPSMLAVSSSGLWLRQIETQSDDIGEYIVYSLRMSQKDMAFSNVIIFVFDKKGKFLSRMDAEQAFLEEGSLRLQSVTLSVPGRPAEHADRYFLPTTLELGHIQDSFASPETMPFWSLPSFIDNLENAGFSGLRHRLYWHSLLATPFLLTGMMLVAAVFSLRLPRRGRIGMLALSGMGVGLGLFFFNNLVQTLGGAGEIPVTLAAWSPAIIMLVAGTATLLHLEDG